MAQIQDIEVFLTYCVQLFHRNNASGVWIRLKGSCKFTGYLSL